MLSRFGFVVPNLRTINRRTYLLLQKSVRNKSTYSNINNQPYPFSNTEAAKWKAYYNREPQSKSVWYSPIVISTSLIIFLIYFCILREENDLDAIIYRPLPEVLKGVDKVFPGFDFNKKPDYVRYHEENKKKEL